MRKLTGDIVDQRNLDDVISKNSPNISEVHLDDIEADMMTFIELKQQENFEEFSKIESVYDGKYEDEIEGEEEVG